MKNYQSVNKLQAPIFRNEADSLDQAEWMHSIREAVTMQES